MLHNLLVRPEPRRLAGVLRWRLVMAKGGKKGGRKC